MKKKLIIMASLSLFFNLSYGQANTSNLSKTTTSVNVLQQEKSLEERLEGTYQIIRDNSKIVEAFTIELLNEIEKRRDDNKEVYYEVSKKTTVKILPRSVINSPDFDPKKYLD